MTSLQLDATTAVGSESVRSVGLTAALLPVPPLVLFALSMTDLRGWNAVLGSLTFVGVVLLAVVALIRWRGHLWSSVGLALVFATGPFWSVPFGIGYLHAWTALLWFGYIALAPLVAAYVVGAGCVRALSGRVASGAG